MPAEQDERLQNELSLLESMYPSEVTWDGNRRELKYSSTERSFQLRLPDGYLVDQLPEILSAAIGRTDVRGELKQYIDNCEPGEEVLDSIIAAFNELTPSLSPNQTTESHPHEDAKNVDSARTVIVWLHHLLNTNKRKQALSPASSDVTGLTKPGYPGVLIYSGPAEAVGEHVDELKQLNWQAFQVRLESGDEWTFAHGAGVREVETMKEVVADIGEARKEQFLEAMRMK